MVEIHNSEMNVIMRMMRIKLLINGCPALKEIEVHRYKDCSDNRCHIFVKLTTEMRIMALIKEGWHSNAAVVMLQLNPTSVQVVSR